MKVTGVVLLTVCMGAALAYKTYDGYQVMKTREITADMMPALQQLKNNPAYDFWTLPRVGRPLSIMTGPENVEILRDALNRLRLEPTVQISDVGVTVRTEREQIEEIRSTEIRSPKAATYDRYMTFDEIMAFIDEVIAANPSIASKLALGTSTEGRPLQGIKISGGSGRKAVFMDCAIHAREWMAPPVCMKTIEDVIASTELQNLVDWYIVPVANPDGYSYAWSDQRLWRKTRRPNPGSNCVGTDPNRNFDFLWNSDNNNNFCAEDFPGASAFSEPECAAIGGLVNTMGNSGELILYTAMHSHGALLLYPWGNTSDPAPTAPELRAAADEAADIIAASRNTIYDVGPAGESLYFTYGASDDYAYGVANVPYSYTFELPSGGSAGFNPPPSQIRPVVTETVPGVISLVRRAENASRNRK